MKIVANSGIQQASLEVTILRALAVSCPGVPSLERFAAFLRTLAESAGTTRKLDLEVHSGGGPIEIEINGTCGSFPSLGSGQAFLAKMKRVYSGIMSLFI